MLILTALKTMVVFFAFFFLGILLTKRKMLPSDSARTLSILVTTLFNPAMSFQSMALNFTFEKLGSYISIALLGAVLILACLPVSIIVRKKMPGAEAEKLAVEYSMVISNYGFLGYPLILTLFGQEMLAKFVMFSLASNLYAFGYYFPKFMPQGKKSLTDTVRRLMNPTMIAILIGMLFGLSGLEYPAVVEDAMTTAANCVAPCAMLVAGMSIGKLPLKAAFRERRAFVISGIRLIVLPWLFILAGLIGCRVLGMDSAVIRIAGIYGSIPLGLNPVVFAETFGKDGSFGAKCSLISMLLSLITLPVMFAVIEQVMMLV